MIQCASVIVALHPSSFAFLLSLRCLHLPGGLLGITIFVSKPVLDHMSDFDYRDAPFGSSVRQSAMQCLLSSTLENGNGCAMNPLHSTTSP